MSVEKVRKKHDYVYKQGLVASKVDQSILKEFKTLSRSDRRTIMSGLSKSMIWPRLFGVPINNRKTHFPKRPIIQFHGTAVEELEWLADIVQWTGELEDIQPLFQDFSKLFGNEQFEDAQFILNEVNERWGPSIWGLSNQLILAHKLGVDHGVKREAFDRQTRAHLEMIRFVLNDMNPTEITMILNMPQLRQPQLSLGMTSPTFFPEDDLNAKFVWNSARTGFVDVSHTVLKWWESSKCYHSESQLFESTWSALSNHCDSSSVELLVQNSVLANYTLHGGYLTSLCDFMFEDFSQETATHLAREGLATSSPTSLLHRVMSVRKAVSHGEWNQVVADLVVLHNASPRIATGCSLNELKKHMPMSFGVESVPWILVLAKVCDPHTLHEMLSDLFERRTFQSVENLWSELILRVGEEFRLQLTMEILKPEVLYFLLESKPDQDIQGRIELLNILQREFGADIAAERDKLTAFSRVRRLTIARNERRLNVSIEAIEESLLASQDFLAKIAPLMSAEQIVEYGLGGLFDVSWKNIFESVRDEYVYGVWGLDSYVSLRIRHNFFEQVIHGVFQSTFANLTSRNANAERAILSKLKALILQFRNQLTTIHLDSSSSEYAINFYFSPQVLERHIEEWAKLRDERTLVLKIMNLLEARRVESGRRAQKMVNTQLKAELHKVIDDKLVDGLVQNDLEALHLRNDLRKSLGEGLARIASWFEPGSEGESCSDRIPLVDVIKAAQAEVDCEIQHTEMVFDVDMALALRLMDVFALVLGNARVHADCVVNVTFNSATRSCIISNHCPNALQIAENLNRELSNPNVLKLAKEGGTGTSKLGMCLGKISEVNCEYRGSSDVLSLVLDFRTEDK